MYVYICVCNEFVIATVFYIINPELKKKEIKYNYNNNDYHYYYYYCYETIIILLFF